MKELSQLLKDEKLYDYEAEEIIENYLFMFSNESISLIEKEPLENYLKFIDNRGYER